MSKQVVQSDQAPAAVGPYSQAIKVGQTLYCSGQIPLTAAGELVAGGVAEQTRQVLRNLTAVIEAAGGTMAEVVKTTIYCVDLGEFQTINQTYAEFFPGVPPARATVQVSALPRAAQVEIDAVAVLGG